MTPTNAGNRPDHSGDRRHLWLAAIMCSLLTACAAPRGASEADSTRLLIGKVVAVGPLTQLAPTRPDRCARPVAEFDEQRGYAVMYRSQVGYRTRVVALNKEELVALGEVVGVDERACNVSLRGLRSD